MLTSCFSTLFPYHAEAQTTHIQYESILLAQTYFLIQRFRIEPFRNSHVFWSKKIDCVYWNTQERISFKACMGRI